MWRSLLIPVKVILVEEKEKELDWIVFKRELKREKQMAGGEAPIKTMFCKGYYLSGLFVHLFCNTKIVIKIESCSQLDKNMSSNILRFFILNLKF